MKKNFFYVIVSVLLVGASCTPKVSPTGTAVAALPDISAVSTDQSYIAAGQTIFTTKCTKCHKAKTDHVTSHTYDEQKSVMNAMVKKAKLSNEEIGQLAAYVLANARK